ncbi:TRYG1 Tryptase, partial [Atractosteus spatula]|nr:TRYG1 Tryptase [Atractosteus spatula]
MYQRDVRKAPREVTRVVIHDSYVNELRFDLALLQLRQRVRRSKHIRPVKLSRTPFPPGTECWVTGWGRTGPKVSLRSPGILQELKVTLLDQESCKQMYPRDSIEPGNLCAWGKKKGKGTCQGDSGSPLVCQTSDSWEQAGIVNWADGCAQKATVYANVTHYIDWITKHVGGLD